MRPPLAIPTLLLALGLAGAAAWGEEWDPVPAARQVVEFAGVRFTVLAPTIVRIEARGAASPAVGDDRPTLVIKNRRNSAVDFRAHNESGVLRLSAANWTLAYDPAAPPSGPSGACANPVPGTDQSGGTRLRLLPNLTQAACCAACDSDHACDAFVLATDSATCYLMANVTATKRARNRVLGRKPACFGSGSLSASVSLPGGEAGVWHAGQTVSPRNLRGVQGELDCYSDPRQCLAQYVDTEAPGVLSRDGWALVDDSPTPRLNGTADTAGRFGPWLDPAPPRDACDWYLVLGGRDYAAAADDWGSVSGRPPLPPLPALEPWWSRHDPLDEAELTALLGGFRDRGVAIGAVSVDMQWHVGGFMATPPHVNGPGGSCSPQDDDGTDPPSPAWRQPRPAAAPPGPDACNGWGGWTWNGTMWPGASDWVARLAAGGASSPTGGSSLVVLNVHPETGVDHCQGRYGAFSRAMGVWPPGNATFQCNFTDLRYVSALFDSFVAAEGNGLGQVAFWPDWYGCGGPGGAGTSKAWGNHVFGSYLSVARGLRPFQLSRRGGLGDQIWPVAFSGDTFQSWEVLRYQVNFTARAASAALQLWSHDVGMFHRGADAPGACVRGDGNASDPLAAELYLRSMQAAVFWPVLRMHCRFCERRPWVFRHLSEEMLAALRLRHAVLPALYTQLALWSRGAAPAPVRSVFLDWPEEPAAYDAAPAQFLWGSAASPLVVAPVVRPARGGLAPARLWVPPGRWCTFAATMPSNGTDCSLSGPAHVTVRSPPGQTPALARLPALLPMQDATTPASAQAPTLLRWVCIGAGAAGLAPNASLAASARLYQDDGVSPAEGTVPAVPGARTLEAGFTITADASGRVSGAVVSVPGGGTAGSEAVELWGLGAAAAATLTVDGVPRCSGAGAAGANGPCWAVQAKPSESVPADTVVVRVPAPAAAQARTLSLSWEPPARA